jgi:hypothetical protein
MSKHPTLIDDTVPECPIDSDVETMEGYRRFARLMAEFLIEADLEHDAAGVPEGAETQA